MTMNRADILDSLKQILEENFEIAPEEVIPEASLYKDLDLDSIDAVDLVVALQGLTGKKIKPADFKTVRTIADVIDATEELLK